MKAVLRIALAYFDMSIIQRWINAAGLVVLAMAGAFIVMSQGPGDSKIVFGVCCFGAGLILVLPAFGGGIGMRLASRPGVLQLRPHGRARLLAGTTLAVTLFALVATLPSLAVELYFAVRAFERGALDFPPPLAMFQFMWAAFALSFIYVFAVSRSLLGMVAYWLLPAVLTGVGRNIDDWHLLLAPWQVLAFGLLGWILFAGWYLRAASIRRPAHVNSSSNTTGENTPFDWLLASENARTDEPTRHRATWQYLLGCASSRFFVITGLWIAAVFVLMHVFAAPGKRPGQMLFMLPFLIFHIGTVGYTSARRARFLWLRAGMSREALFHMVERQALRASLTTWAIVAVAAVAVAAYPDPSRLPQLLVYTAAQCVVAVVAFYAGLAIVKDWHIGDMLLFIFLGVLFVVQMVPGAAAMRDGSLTDASVVIAPIAAALALVLRFHAMRRWRGLDWQVARPMKLDSRRS